MLPNLKIKYGDWALITGASSGIGKEFASVFAAQKINLVLVARRENLLIDLKENLEKEYEINVEIVVADLSMQEGIDKVFSDTINFNINILVNNAGYGATGALHEMKPDVIRNMIDVNTTNYAILTQHYASRMITQNRGAIFIISSVVANIPVPFMSLYSATKAFDLAFGESLWYELKKHKIDVCTVCPGSTDTEFNGLRANGKASNVRSAKQVVETAIKSIGNKVVVTDGFMNKLNTFLTRLVPRSLRIKATGGVSSKVLNQ